jgi:DNA invertase Pin-like site-specific DNA recombinase
MEGRDALGQMLRDVQEGRAEFSIILVYDVSRWGRFQNPDESAFYEYACQQAGVFVHYCAEQFSNDGSPVSTIIKSIKRTMAGEYSRELSTKVFQGACRLVKLGLRTRLAGRCGPPTVTHADPLHQTLAHLRMVFPRSQCPPAEFQLHFQRPFLG